MTGPTRVHNSTCKGQARRIATHHHFDLAARDGRHPRLRDGRPGTPRGIVAALSDPAVRLLARATRGKRGSFGRIMWTR